MALREYISTPHNLLRDTNQNPTPLLLKYWRLRDMSYGKERRELILEVLKDGFCFAVNRKYCLQTKHDPDLKRLIKQGKIEIVNSPAGHGVKTTHIKLK
jgi:hypothetical protein